MGNFASTADTAFTPSDAFFLCEAIRTGSLDIVRLFLKKNPALVYATDAAEKSTPWHVAATAGHDVVVRVLIDTTRANSLSNNFDPVSKVINKQNAKGQTPLMLACGGGHSVCARLLLESGAHLLVADMTGRSALHYAALHCRADGQGNDCAELLLAHMQRQLIAQGPAVAPPEVHANVVRKFADTGDMYGRTALHCAAWSGNTRAAHALWSAGADICARTETDCYEPELPCNTGTTPLHYAAMRGHQPMVVLLLAAWHRMASRPAAPLPRPAYARSLLCRPAAPPPGGAAAAAAADSDADAGAAGVPPMLSAAIGEPAAKVAEAQRRRESGQGEQWQGGGTEAHGDREPAAGEVAEAEVLAAGAQQREQADGGRQSRGEVGGPDQDRQAAGGGSGGGAGGEELSQTCPKEEQQQQDAAWVAEDGAAAAVADKQRSAEATPSASRLSAPSPDGSEHGGGADGGGSQGDGDALAAAPAVALELPPPPSPRPPPLDPRMMVDAYGLTPYAMAGKRGQERGSMLLELLDPRTDFTAGDSEQDDDDDDDGSGSGGTDGDGQRADKDRTKKVSGGGGGRGGRNGYRRDVENAGDGDDDGDDDDVDSEEEAAGPLLLWEGVEVVRDLAADPEGFFKMQQTVALLQLRALEDPATAEGPAASGSSLAAAAEGSGSRRTGATPRVSVTKDVIPDCFLCPMTCKLFRDPVVAADGVTYEREAIERHLRHVSTSPVTKQHLASKQLYDNSALRSTIEHWAAGLLPPPPPPPPPRGAGDSAPRGTNTSTGTGTGLIGRR